MSKRTAAHIRSGSAAKPTVRCDWGPKVITVVAANADACRASSLVRSCRRRQLISASGARIITEAACAAAVTSRVRQKAPSIRSQAVAATPAACDQRAGHGDREQRPHVLHAADPSADQAPAERHHQSGLGGATHPEQHRVEQRPPAGEVGRRVGEEHGRDHDRSLPTGGDQRGQGAEPGSRPHGGGDLALRGEADDPDAGAVRRDHGRQREPEPPRGGCISVHGAILAHRWTGRGDFRHVPRGETVAREWSLRAKVTP